MADEDFSTRNHNDDPAEPRWRPPPDDLAGYETLLHVLRRCARTDVPSINGFAISTPALLVQILQHIDQFCDALAAIQRTDELCLGWFRRSPSRRDISPMPFLAIPAEKTVAWNKFCLAISGLYERSRNLSLCFDGTLFGVQALTDLLNVLPRVADVHLRIDWLAMNGRDVQHLARELSRRGNNVVRLELRTDASTALTVTNEVAVARATSFLLPLNGLVETLHITGAGPGFVPSLVRILGHENHTLKNIHLRGFPVSGVALSNEFRKDLAGAMECNCMIESVHVDGLVLPDNAASPFQTILDLNKAGRRYLQHDAASRSKCVEVLAKVKDDLDCLYYHLRENPILCVGYTNDSLQGKRTGKKRKAVDLGVGDVRSNRMRDTTPVTPGIVHAH